MPISADKIRELAGSGEGSALDFKRDDYNWSVRTSNAELAKDLMAMANVIGPNSPPSYILIGVDNAGIVVGVPPNSHLDDAVLHQKVSGLLNLTPTFSYFPVVVDGMSVGVYEITGGQRPYYPVRDSAPSLRRNVAVYRNGSSTDEAPPPMIVMWSREDDPHGQRLRALELRKREAEARVTARLSTTWVNDTPKGMSIGLRIANLGHSGFWVESCRWRAEWNWSFKKELADAGLTLSADYVAPGGEDIFDEPKLVHPGKSFDFTFGWSREKGLAHIQEAEIGLNGFSASWADYHFEILCRSELGEERILSVTARPLG